SPFCRIFRIEHNGITYPRCLLFPRNDRTGSPTNVKMGKRTMSSVVQNSSHPSLSYADSMATSTSDTILLIGRVLLGWIFLRSGYGKIFDIPAYAATFPGRGLPTFLAYIAVPAEFFGGIALILGLATRYVVIVMIVFMLVATFSSHRYWEFTDAAVRRAQDSSFYKNLAMLGGFLFLFVAGSGRLSVDAWLRKQR
ncbi:MAG: DoxX family protein, partial [Pseudolabrys sp.]